MQTIDSKPNPLNGILRQPCAKRELSDVHAAAKAPLRVIKPAGQTGIAAMVQRGGIANEDNVRPTT
jgi:hypothetical protein